MSAEVYNKKQLDAGTITTQMVTALGRLWQEEHGLEVDGYIGPQTQASILSAIAPSELTPGTTWTPWDGPLARQPKNRAEVYEIFGNPGVGHVDSRWQRENIVELHGRNRLPGVPEKWYVKLHKDVEPYAREGLRRAEISSAYQIQRFGGFVFRHIRHNSANPLSMHAFGIAFDVDPGINYAKQFKRGAAPTPWGEEWFKLWPDGVDEAFVEALESCGWTWGGRWQTYVDPMHFEFTGDASV